MTTTARPNSQLSDSARDNLWLHFTRHSGFENGAAVPVISRGEGAYVFDENGRKILDGLAGLFTEIGRAHV